MCVGFVCLVAQRSPRMSFSRVRSGLTIRSVRFDVMCVWVFFPIPYKRKTKSHQLYANVFFLYIYIYIYKYMFFFSSWTTSWSEGAWSLLLSLRSWLLDQQLVRLPPAPALLLPVGNERIERERERESSSSVRPKMASLFLATPELIISSNLFVWCVFPNVFPFICFPSSRVLDLVMDVWRLRYYFN